MAYPFLTRIAQAALYEIFQVGSLINTVARDWSGELAGSGEAVKVILPETPSVQDAGGEFSAAAASPTVRTVTLDKWRETQPLKADMATLAKAGDNLLNQYGSAIGVALVKDIESSILTAAAAFTTSVGTVTTGTALPASVADFFAYKAEFDTLAAPDDNGRYIVCGSELEGAYFDVFGLQSQSGDVAVAEMIRGQAGRKLGLNFVPDVKASDATSKLIGYGYHRNAIALASRPMRPSELAPMTMATVDFKGVGLTVEAWHSPENSCDYIRGQVLFGVAAVSGKGFKIHKK